MRRPINPHPTFRPAIAKTEGRTESDILAAALRCYLDTAECRREQALTDQVTRLLRLYQRRIAEHRARKAGWARDFDSSRGPESTMVPGGLARYRRIGM